MIMQMESRKIKHTVTSTTAIYTPHRNKIFLLNTVIFNWGYCILLNVFGHAVSDTLCCEATQ